MSGFEGYVTDRETFVEAEQAAREMLAFPFYPELEASDVEWVADRLRAFFEDHSP